MASGMAVAECIMAGWKNTGYRMWHATRLPSPLLLRMRDNRKSRQ